VQLCLFVAGLCLVNGCSLKRQAPVKHAFIVEARRPKDANSPNSSATLRVRSLVVAPQFDTRQFVYRNTALNFESDFYHEFLVTPRALFTTQVRLWLDASGLFRAVLDPMSKVEATHSLEGNITDLYADFKDKTAPKSVLAVQFILTNDEGMSPQIVFYRNYRQEVPVERRDAEGLARGWSEALAHILTAFEQDLAKINPRARAQ
jgi:cholesterol transport system auxiliary component